MQLNKVGLPERRAARYAVEHFYLEGRHLRQAGFGFFLLTNLVHAHTQVNADPLGS
jgi:hypothetical protein